MRNLFLGVDGGQSSTTAMAGDESGRVLGVGRAGPCNHAGESGGRERFLLAIDGSVRGALDQAGACEAVFEAACLGLSGGFEDKEALARQAVKARRYAFKHDAEVALTGATAGGPGIIVIAGTGSMAFGKNAGGRTARAGGWGYVFGDEGGAFDLVRQALRACLRAEERWGPQTSLLRTLIEAAHARDANQALHRFYTGEFPRERVAGFARLVDQAAREGDGVARDLLQAAGQTLATLAGAVRAQLFAEREAVQVCYTGGVFQSDLVRERFRTLVELKDGNRVAPPVYGPAAGALLVAYRLAGIECRLDGAPQEKTV